MEKKRKAGRPPGATNKRGEILRKKNKEILIQSLRDNMGIITPAVRAAQINRTTFNRYYDNDEDFRKQVDEIREEGIDFVESQLLKQIKDGGAAQTIFFLKCRGRGRGYIEQQDTNMTIDAIRIKYIVPNEHELLRSGKALPLDNEVIRLQLPENEDDRKLYKT